MTVGELINELQNYDEDAVILFKPYNSYYVERMTDAIQPCKVIAFWGSDYKALCIMSGGQTGGATFDYEEDYTEEED